ncbi:MAG: SoxR reducing system RseC family protein [Alistipes sp.]|nr:SoxR reducing system RseC family protein [Alistipes sp.]
MRVAIEVMEACGSCASRKACAMGQSDKREIVVYTDDASAYSVGEVVNVSARQTIGITAVLLCYVLPLVVMIAALASMVMLGCSEGIAALVSLVSIALYYAILGALHKRISKKIVFTINKI